MADQIPFEANPFADAELIKNTEPRCACILLLDISGSMQGAAINELNAGLVQFKDELAADSLGTKRVEVAVVTFGEGVQVATDFCNPDVFIAPNLKAAGSTPLGAALNKALDLLADRKQKYRENGIHYYRPWIFLVTDGAPTDEWQTASSRLKEAQSTNKLSFFPVAVQGANLDVLKQISMTEPINLQGLRFRDMFKWLSSSLKSVSHSKPEEKVQLDNPTAPAGWGSV